MPSLIGTGQAAAAKYQEDMMASQKRKAARTENLNAMSILNELLKNINEETPEDIKKLIHKKFIEHLKELNPEKSN